MALFRKSSTMPAKQEALPGRGAAMQVPATHFVNGHRISAPFPAGLRDAYFALGCFWGAERIFWQQPGVYSTAVGYAGGFTPNPTYEEVCTGQTGHTEIVRVIYDPQQVDYEDLLKVFWESHDPTQGMRQGNDRGTSYRSIIIVADDEQRAAAQLGAAARAAAELPDAAELVAAAASSAHSVAAAAEDVHGVRSEQLHTELADKLARVIVADQV